LDPAELLFLLIDSLNYHVLNDYAHIDPIIPLPLTNLPTTDFIISIFPIE